MKTNKPSEGGPDKGKPARREDFKRRFYLRCDVCGREHLEASDHGQESCGCGRLLSRMPEWSPEGETKC